MLQAFARYQLDGEIHVDELKGALVMCPSDLRPVRHWSNWVGRQLGATGRPLWTEWYLYIEYICSYTRIHTHIYIHVYIYTHILYIYIYVYIYIYTHIYICMHTCIHVMVIIPQKCQNRFRTIKIPGQWAWESKLAGCSWRFAAAAKGLALMPPSHWFSIGSVHFCSPSFWEHLT